MYGNPTLPSSRIKLNQVNEKYKACLDAGKTERECVKLAKEEAEKAGYVSLEEAKAPLKAGDKIYAVGMDKSIALFQIGNRPLEAGMNILGAHIDLPRIDVKQNPLYENEEFAYLDTHYYGGIKKYQWVTLPLALHGVVVKKDGTVIEVNIGEKSEDPVFVITDLLVHLAAKQMEKKAGGGDRRRETGPSFRKPSAGAGRRPGKRGEGSGEEKRAPDP